jgi:hypothetical protein
MIRNQYPFFYKRYAYDLSNNILHDLKNEQDKCSIDSIDEEDIEAYSSLNEGSLILDHPTYKPCPHCMTK